MSKANLLKNTEIFSCLDEKELKEIESLCEYKTFEKNELIFEKGNNPGNRP